LTPTCNTSNQHITAERRDGKENDTEKPEKCNQQDFMVGMTGRLKG
jgi:hypothetical protein